MSGSNGSQQYCLRWNNYQNNLTNVFDQLLQSESFVDVTLACDGESLKCHKMILSACSPFFQNLFFQNPCTHPIVILKDMRWEDLKAVVDFMYRGEINVSQDQLTPLLKVAAALKIRGLADVSQRPGLTGSSASKNQADHDTSDKKGDLQKASNASDGCVTESDPLAAPLSTFSKGLSNLRRKRPRISSPDRNASSEDDEHSRDPNDFLSASGCDSDMEHSSSSYLAQGFQDSPASNLLTESLGPSSFVSTAINNGVSTNILCSSGSTPGIHNVPASVSMSLMNMHNSMATASTSSTQSSIPNEMDLKPGIVEMIREEERAKMLESSFGWTGGPSPATLSDTYQYQLQSLWQKCWSNNQSNNPPTLRFRERGPMKSWRPETMAEAIFAVLREGLSLSQAARKYDIPYPTFVLYANRVHNMLGPSTDGCAGADMVSDMRPKGRGRPQRILLGSWPEDHVRGVIRAVVFRDPGAKEDSLVVSRDTNFGLGSQPSATVTNGNDMRNSPPFNPNCGTAHQNFFNQHRSQTGAYDATVSSGLSDSKLSKSFPSPGMQLTLRGSASLMDDESLKNGAAKSGTHSRLPKSIPSGASYPTLDNQECSMSDLVSDITEEVQVKAEIAYECLEEQVDVFGVSEQQVSGHNKTSEVPSEASQVDRDLEKNLQGVVDDQNSNEAPETADKVDYSGQNVSGANHFSAS